MIPEREYRAFIFFAISGVAAWGGLVYWFALALIFSGV